MTRLTWTTPALLLGLMLGAAPPAGAQVVGVEGGLTLSTVRTGQVPGYTRRHTVGASGGVFASIRIHGATVQADLLLTQKGTELAGGGTVITYRFLYGELPVTVRLPLFHVRDRAIDVLAGFSSALRLRASQTYDHGTTFDIKDAVGRWDLGVVVGAGLDLGHIRAEGRYTIGLRNIDMDRPNGRTRTRTLTLLVGVRMR